MFGFRPILTVAATLLLTSTASAQNGRPAAKPRPDQPSATPKIGKPIIQDPVSQALAKPLVTTVYHWQVGSNPVSGPSAATHVCLLTKIAGAFRGAGERVALYIDTGASGGPRWMLNGTSGQNELMAEATCAAKNQFAPAAGGGSQLVATGYGNHMVGGCSGPIISMPDDADTHAFFISGISGKFNGGGESVAAVRQGKKGAISLSGCSGNVDGTLLSIGNTGATKVLYRTSSARLPAGSKNTNFAANMSGPKSDGFWGSLGHFFAQSGEDLSVDLTNPGTTTMVPQNEALCGIVGITGKLQGYGEEVTISKASGYWQLHVNEQGEDASLAAVSRCFARDQRY